MTEEKIEAVPPPVKGTPTPAIVAIVCASLVLLGIIFPWVSMMGLGIANGIDAAPQGFISLAGGVLALIFAIMATSQKKLDSAKATGLIVGGGAAAGGAAWFFIAFKSAASSSLKGSTPEDELSRGLGKFAQEMFSVGMGVYLVIGCGIALLVIGFMAMSRKN